MRLVATVFANLSSDIFFEHYTHISRISHVLTAGEENIPQLSPNSRRGSASSIEYFLCPSETLNL
jgi:hypothetical protein